MLKPADVADWSDRARRSSFEGLASRAVLIHGQIQADSGERFRRRDRWHRHDVN
jgi:hypothetical protein